MSGKMLNLLAMNKFFMLSFCLAEICAIPNDFRS